MKIAGALSFESHYRSIRWLGWRQNVPETEDGAGTGDVEVNNQEVRH